MPEATKTQFPTIDQITRSAVEHVQKICKGNGIKTDSVTLVSHAVSLQTMNAGTYLELKPAMSEKGVPGKIMSGQMAASREDAVRQMDQAMIGAARDPAQKARIADALLKRPDKGFGLAKQAIPLDFLKREYTWHDGCPACKGRGQDVCPRCMGRKTEPCVKCSGRGLMPCPTCRSSGMVQGARCPTCSAQRYVPCDLCRRTGFMTCRVCSATGVTKCGSCNGVGWKSTVITMQVAAIPYFEYDAKSIPAAAADMIETQAAALAAAGKIKIMGRTADNTDNVLGANYEVEFPFGNIVFMLGKKEAKAKLFGYGGDLLSFPPVIDVAVRQAVEELDKAAQDIGSVAQSIKKASRYRVIAMAFANVPRIGPAKTVSLLLKHYDIGLTRPMAEKIASLSEATTSMITRKPRLYGLAGGIVAGAVLTALYYLLPARASLAAMFPKPWLDFVLDIPPPLLTGAIAALCIRYAAAHAIEKALGSIKNARKKPELPRAGILGRWGYGAGALITLAMMEISLAQNGTGPYWYMMAKTFLTAGF